MFRTQLLWSVRGIFTPFPRYLPWLGSEEMLNECGFPSLVKAMMPCSVPGPMLGARETDRWALGLSWQ